MVLNPFGSVGGQYRPREEAFQFPGQEEFQRRLRAGEAEARGRMERTGPSAAEIQLRQGTEQSLAALQSSSASQRGMPLASRQRGMQAATQQAMGQMGMQQAQLRAEETVQQQQMADQMVQFYISQGLGMAQAQMQAQIDMESMRAGQYQASKGREVQQQSAIIGAVGAGAAAFAGS